MPAGYGADMLLRDARGDEAGPLSELALRSKGHWGYDPEFLERCRDELTLRPGDLVTGRAAVAQDGARVVGFYTLAGEAPDGELACLFVEPDTIGTGVGRRLWDHAVAAARRLEFRRLTIDSDPFAEGFYLRVGAVRVGTVPSGSIPGRVLPRLVYRLH